MNMNQRKRSTLFGTDARSFWQSATLYALFILMYLNGRPDPSGPIDFVVGVLFFIIRLNTRISTTQRVLMCFEVVEWTYTQSGELMFIY